MRWADGETPEVPIDGPGGATDGLARDLADAVSSLGRPPVPPDALADPGLHSYRAEPLAAMCASARTYLEGLPSLPGLDLDACLRVWEAAIALPGSKQTVAPRWLHGDLLAENLLVRNGQLTAVLDFGGLAVGDPTVDLIVGWEVLDRPRRRLFRSLLGVDEATWLRGRAWAS